MEDFVFVFIASPSGKIAALVVFLKKSITFALALKKYFKVDSLAQQVEHIPFKDGVLGSSPRRITPKRIP